MPSGTGWRTSSRSPSGNNGRDAYEVAVRVYIVPGVGAQKLAKLEPDHLEELYLKIIDEKGRKAGTAHQVHRTIRRALGVAHRRGYGTRNVAALATAPRLDESPTKPERSSRPPPAAATAPAGPSPWPSVCGREKSSA